MFPVSINARSAVDGRGKGIMASHSRFGFQRRVGENSSAFPCSHDEGRARRRTRENERDATIGEEKCGNAFAPSYRFDASHPNRDRRNAVARNSEITHRDFSASVDISIYMEIVLLFSFYPLSFIYIMACESAPYRSLFICYHLSIHQQLAARYHGSFYQAS